jgi:hypothetical protein
MPARDAELARFINEIVFAEESDLDLDGIPKSHFEMYLEAMEEVGADQSAINFLMKSLKSNLKISTVIEFGDLEPATAVFLRNTFDIIHSGNDHEIAAAFTYGREDLIPDMFLKVLDRADPEQVKFRKFRYYLERHIELDGDEHGPLALQMVARLCGDDESKWEAAKLSAHSALEARLKLWDGIAAKLSAVAI